MAILILMGKVAFILPSAQSSHLARPAMKSGKVTAPYWALKNPYLYRIPPSRSLEYLTAISY